MPGIIFRQSRKQRWILRKSAKQSLESGKGSGSKYVKVWPGRDSLNVSRKNQVRVESWKVCSILVVLKRPHNSRSFGICLRSTDDELQPAAVPVNKYVGPSSSCHAGRILLLCCIQACGAQKMI